MIFLGLGFFGYGRMYNWQYLNVLFYFNVDLGNAQKMFVKMYDRNFEVMLSSLMIKNNWGFC